MKSIFKVLMTLAALAALCATAHAAIEVSITAVVPVDGTIGEGETATIAWKIDGGSASGTYEVVVGGDGTAGSGEALSDSNSTGSFNGTLNGTTSVSADQDLTDGDGDYIIYVIATNSSDETDTGSASTTITLDTPPGTVQGVTAGSGDRRVFVTWTQLDDTDINHYLVYYGNSPGTSTEDYQGADASEGISPVDVGNVAEAVLSGLSNGVRYYIRVTAVDEGGTESPLSEEVGATPADAQGVADLSGDTDGCFIATAAYGSYDHEKVLTLRAFRDRVLRQSAWGRAFIKAYYHYSPPIAAQIAKRPALRAVVRAGLTPLDWVARIALAGYSRFAAAASVGLFFAMTFAGRRVLRRKVDA